MSSLPADVKAIVDSVAGKDLAHALGAYIYIGYYGPDSDQYRSASKLLIDVYGEETARNVLAEVDRALRPVSSQLGLIKRGVLTDYIYTKYVAPRIKEEAQRRLAGAGEDERKVLAAASAMITKALKSEMVFYGEFYGNMKISKYRGGAVEVSSTDSDEFFRAVSAILESSEIPNPGVVFSKHLLGISYNWSNEQHIYIGLDLFPDSMSLVESLAAKLPRYVQVLDRQALKQVLQDLFKERDRLRASVLKSKIIEPTEPSSNLRFIEYLYSLLSTEQLCERAYVKGVLWKCNVNPLVYEDLRELFRVFYNVELLALRDKVVGALKALGADKVSCDSEGRACTLVGAGDRPVFVYVEPLAAYPDFFSKLENVVKVIVEAAVPRDPDFLASFVLGEPQLRDALWAFLDPETNALYILGPTYRHGDHFEVVKALAMSFKIEFVGFMTEDVRQALEALRQVQPAVTAQPQPAQAPAAATTVQAPAAPPRLAACSPERLRVRRGRDVLEDVVAAVLEDLGFKASVDYTFTTKAGTTIEVDVWGDKNIGDSRFYVYASCKNLDRPVDVSVVREEIGRVGVMPVAPHVRILVVSSIQDTAKKEALANGFVVVEVGRKVDESSAEDACRLIYNRLNAVFVSMAPTWLQELAKLTDELRASLQELASVDNRLRSVADELIGLLQRSAH